MFVDLAVLAKQRLGRIMGIQVFSASSEVGKTDYKICKSALRHYYAQPSVVYGYHVLVRKVDNAL